MKQLWTAICIVAILSVGAMVNMAYLDHFTGQLSQKLEQASDAALEGDLESAAQFTQQAQDEFDSRSFYLHVTLAHQDIDEIEIAFSEAQQLLRSQEPGGEYAAANARLIARLGLLSEAERLNLKNVL